MFKNLNKWDKISLVATGIECIAIGVICNWFYKELAKRVDAQIEQIQKDEETINNIDFSIPPINFETKIED